MKKVISIAVTAVLGLAALMAPVSMKAEVIEGVKVKLDGKLISFPDAQPYVNEDERTLVPVRFVSEAMGCKVEWEESRELVTITKAPYRILLRIGENSAIVNDGKSDVKKEFDTQAVLRGDRTFVPLRFVSETLGAGVAWDGVNNTVILRSDGVVEVVATPVPTATPVATPTPSPIVTNHKNYVEHFELVEGFNPPDDFIKPDINVIHFMDGSGPYFDIVISNPKDFLGTTSHEYSYKTTCLNMDIVNSISAGNGKDTVRIDEWRNLGGVLQGYIDSNLRCERLTTFAGSKTYRRYSMEPSAEKLRLAPGMQLEMEVRFKYKDFEQVYKKLVTIYEN